MLVETISKNGDKTTYGYAPEHKERVIDFYQRIYWIGDISGYKATLNDGTVVAVGACA